MDDEMRYRYTLKIYLVRERDKTILLGRDGTMDVKDDKAALESAIKTLQAALEDAKDKLLSGSPKYY